LIGAARHGGMRLGRPGRITWLHIDPGT